uniref:Uncharacterized protein n=1 Tax=Rhodosorus marinus TaxID=101924 RepID=A0A7S2ZVJ2_9RHOD|mmetsp:Transcript_34002/g.133305  ORF Transcript_34002/g.133305 Transcript_34002/m.133305 type:complete len:607 (+) Transcript_34002:36-1856(+)
MIEIMQQRSGSTPCQLDLAHGRRHGGIVTWQYGKTRGGGPGLVVCIVFCCGLLLGSSLGLTTRGDISIEGVETVELVSEDVQEHIFGFGVGGTASIEFDSLDPDILGSTRLVFGGCLETTVRRDTRYLLRLGPQLDTLLRVEEDGTEIRPQQAFCEGEDLGRVCRVSDLTASSTDFGKSTASVTFDIKGLYQLMLVRCTVNSETRVRGAYEASWQNPNEAYAELGFEEQAFPTASGVFAGLFGVLLLWMGLSGIVFYKHFVRCIQYFLTMLGVLMSMIGYILFALEFWNTVNTSERDGAILVLRAPFAIVSELCLISTLVGLSSGMVLLPPEFNRSHPFNTFSKFRVILLLVINSISTTLYYFLAGRNWISAVTRVIVDVFTSGVLVYIWSQERAIFRSFVDIVEGYGYKYKSTPLYWRHWAVRILPWLYTIVIVVRDLVMMLADLTTAVQPIVLYCTSAALEFIVFGALTFILRVSPRNRFTCRIEWDTRPFAAENIQERTDDDQSVEVESSGEHLRSWNWGDPMPSLDQVFTIAAQQREMKRIIKLYGDVPVFYVVEELALPNQKTRPQLYLAIGAARRGSKIQKSEHSSHCPEQKSTDSEEEL